MIYRRKCEWQACLRAELRLSREAGEPTEQLIHLAGVVFDANLKQAGRASNQLGVDDARQDFLIRFWRVLWIRLDEEDAPWTYLTRCARTHLHTLDRSNRRQVEMLGRLKGALEGITETAAKKDWWP